MKLLIDGDILSFLVQVGDPDLKARWNHAEKLLSQWREETFADDFYIAVKGHTHENFRKRLYPEYKSNRKPMPPDFCVLEIRQMLAKFYGAFECDEIEADDQLSIWKNEFGAENSIICSIDKDLNTIPGIHYNPRTKELYKVSENEGFKFFCKQLLVGDAADNIPGVPGIGKVRAERLLSAVEEPKDLKQRVEATYQERLEPGLWEDYLTFNGILLYLLREKGDSFEEMWKQI